jgi:hypothetical protein
MLNKDYELHKRHKTQETRDINSSEERRTWLPGKTITDEPIPKISRVTKCYICFLFF